MIRALLLVLAGAAIAFVGSVCGIGGGLFAVPLLHYGFRLDLRAAVATSLCLVGANAFASTVTESLHDGSALLWDVVLPLAAGALAGAQFGYLASRRLSERFVKGLFAGVIAIASWRMLGSGDAGVQPGEFHSVYTIGRAASVAAIGLLAGTASPLLGIGGGMIVVPGLLLSMPEIGGLGARAAALAVACVTSARSIHLYAKERQVDLSVAPWFVVGGLAGAVGGVQAVHAPGIAAMGRQFLGALLVLTALRFAIDASRRSVQSVEPGPSSPA